MSAPILPDVLIIYLPDDGNIHMIGSRIYKKKWKYTAPVVWNKSKLPEVKRDFLRMGFKLFDQAHEAAKTVKDKPRLEMAMPIILYRGSVTLQEAIQSFETLQLSILNSPDVGDAS